jgi:hypothetical protein
MSTQVLLISLKKEKQTFAIILVVQSIHPLEIPTIISPLLAHGAAGEFRVQKQDTYQGFLFRPEVPSTRVVACSETADSTKACSRLSPTTILTLTLICNPTPQEEVQGHECKNIRQQLDPSDSSEANHLRSYIDCRIVMQCTCSNFQQGNKKEGPGRQTDWPTFLAEHRSR